MDRLHQLTVFTAVADAGSFAGGARRLQMSAPAVTRAVAALEKELRVKLLTRTTRHVRVTPLGQHYLEDVRRILSELEAADEAARGAHATPLGTLTVTAPVSFGRQFLVPAIAEYLTQYPDTTVSAVFDDRVLSPLEEGIDVSVRIGTLPDSGHHAVKVGTVRRVLCAAPQYLKARGTPEKPADLLQHVLIGSTTVSPTSEWHFRGAPAVRAKPRLVLSSNDAVIAACVHGLGIARVLSYQPAAALAAGQLELILRDFEPDALPVHVLYRGGRQASAAVRAFVDIAIARLRADRDLARR